MDNFVFAHELELSILEHRTELLLKMLDEVGVNRFFPAIIYNESFWKLGREKKLSILIDKQSSYLGDNPINKSVFYCDSFYLDIIKSVKITYFNYTKLSLETFIQILQTKNKYSITDFDSFGSEKSKTLSLVNEIILLKDNIQKISNEKNLLGKIECLKFFSKFNKYKNINSLIIIYRFEFEFWKIFFESLKKLDESQNTNLDKNSSFTFIFLNKSRFAKDIQLFDKLKESTNYSIEAENIDISELTFRDKYDFIFLDSVFSTLPTDIITKYGHNYYNAFGRLVYVDRTNPKKALEDIALLESPLKQLDQMDQSTLDNIDFELTWKLFDNKETINILETAEVIHERSLLRFSIISLKLLINLIKASKPGSLIHIWDYSENAFTKYQLGIFKDENNLSRFLFDFELNQKILSLFEDIQVQTKIYSSSEILSTEILEDQEGFVRLEEVMDFVNFDKSTLQDFFDVKNYSFYSDLKSMTRGLNFFKNLREKNIMLFGLSSLLYDTGFKSFKKKVKSSDKLSSLLESDKEFENYHLGSYEKEYYRNILPKISDRLDENKGILITKDRSNKNNKELLNLLDELFIDPDFFFDFINKNWEEISNLSKHKTSYKLLEINI